MKLLLTSNGLSNDKLKEVFVKNLGKKPEKTRILVVRNHKPKIEKDEYLVEIIKELEACKIKKENIISVNVAHAIDLKKLETESYDVFWSSGGNTFIILDNMRKTGVYGLMQDAIEAGKFYVGTSAGTILASKDIQIAGWGKEADPNYIGLKDLSSLGLINYDIFPHYRDELKEEVVEYAKKTKRKVETLKDGEALLILDGKKEKV